MPLWTPASVESTERLSPRIVHIRLRPQTWRQPRAGQHVDVRLTAEDGYQAQRSYSLLSPPELESFYDLAIERLDDGEVSPYFFDVAQPGDEVEVLGPVGGHFVWPTDQVRPVLLVGGGSGVVPLLSMAQHRTALRDPQPPMTLVYAAREMAELILWPALQALEQQSGFTTRLVLSRASTAPRPQDKVGRIDAAYLASVLQPLGQSPLVYVCGSNGFVETVVQALLALGVPPADIRTERFGG
ncbi:FAD-binding oxidoreductase [Variovorax sp. HJSM1_2]|uniref:FAD-binding oxidoreductase n=1 Tax=Variovorax sp. HJSM1_2 TaxID=3366263 RepID=UPI003BDB2C48